MVYFSHCKEKITLEKRLQCSQKGMIYTFIRPRQFINQSGDKTILICIHLKSKCVSCSTSGFFPIQQTRHWPGHDLASVLPHTLTERRCPGNNQEHALWRVSPGLETPDLPHSYQRQTETGACALASIIGIKLPSYCRYFFLEKAKREIWTRAASVSRSPKICVHMCAGRPPYLFPLVVRWRSCSAWLLRISSFSLLTDWLRSH